MGFASPDMLSNEGTVPMDHIKILPFFKAFPPKPETLERKRAVWISTGTYGSPLIIDEKGWLLDGYASYLLMCENHERVADVRIKKSPRAVLLAGPPGGRYAAYVVNMGVARRVGPKSTVVLYTGGRVRILEARNIDFNEFRRATDARGMVLPGWHL